VEWGGVVACSRVEVVACGPVAAPTPPTRPFTVFTKLTTIPANVWDFCSREGVHVGVEWGGGWGGWGWG
jgi:hypothetical protein